MVKVIGLIGTIGAGKDTVSDYIQEKYGYNVITMGDIVRGIAKERGVEANRENLTNIQKEHIEKFGDNFFINKVIETIKSNNWEKSIINGIRRPMDSKISKGEFGDDMKLVLVDADLKIRFNRLQNRGRVGDPKTMEEFHRQEQSEFERFDFKKTLDSVDHTIENNGSLEDLNNNIEKLFSDLGFI